MIALGYALIPDVSSAYWIFSVITTQVYLIMYLLMFVAAVRLRRNDPDHPRGYRAPMLIGLCGVGFAASLAALLVGFIPPSQFGGGNPMVYFLIVGGGALGLGLLVPFLFYRFRKPSWKLPTRKPDGGDRSHEHAHGVRTTQARARSVLYIVVRGRARGPRRDRAADLQVGEGDPAGPGEGRPARSAAIEAAGGTAPRASRSPGCSATTAARSARTRTTR